mgnify:CR=1 FL=1
MYRTPPSFKKRSLLKMLRHEFALDWHGIHGAPHWARVRLNGLRLARLNGADSLVAEIFAFLHDSKRENDGYDPGHGQRAAAFARQLNGEFFSLTALQLRLLELACVGHSDGLIEGDVTVRTCWDADRLDLGRVGIVPDPNRLCNSIARQPDIIHEAYVRSVASL